MSRGEESLELLAARELNRRLLEAMPGGVVHVRADGAVLFANAEALRILGLSYDELTNRYTTDFETETIWEDGSHCPASDYPVSRALATSQPQPPTTLGVRKPDGSTSWAVFSAIPLIHEGKLAGAIVTFLDVTSRKQNELALLESEARLRAIMQSVPDHIISMDVEGRIRYANRLPPELSMEDVIGRPTWELASLADRAAVERMIRRVADTKEEQALEAEGPGGRPYALRAGPILVDGELVGITHVATDLAKQRELEARVLVTDRLASIGTLAAGVAHEINNPLTYLAANLEILQRDLASGSTLGASAAEGRLSAAIEGADRIRNIVRDLRSFAHVETGKSRRIDVRELLDSSLRMAEGEIRYRAKIVRDYDPDLSVVTDDSRLGQVFLNLIVNAAQAIPEGDVDHNEIRVSARFSEGHILVEVSDTGAGVAPALSEKLFQPFFTTKEQGRGMGLGLYLCRNIVASMGGEISAAPAEPRGTTFRVRIPATITEPRNSSHPPRSGGGRRARLLVIDDERNILSALAMLLEEHEVTTTVSGREALALLEKEKFDLVLCDIMMPDMTGMDIHQRAKKLAPGLEDRFIFMTGGTFTARAHEFLEGVSNRLLKKPFGERELFEVVDAALLSSREASSR